MYDKVTTQTRYIYRCTNKDCKHVYTLDFEVTTHIGSKGAPKYTVLNHPELVLPINRTPEYHPYTRCPKCGKYAKPNRVTGHTNDTPCDERCTHAKGGECNCSCGGTNHGSAFLSR